MVLAKGSSDANDSGSRCDDSNKRVYSTKKERNGRDAMDGNVLPVHLSPPLSRVTVRVPAVNVTCIGDSVCKRREGRMVVIRLAVVVVVV